MAAHQIAQRLGLATNILNCPWWQDIPEICEASELNLGITVRDRKGNEVTFWPEEDLGDDYELPRTAKKKPKGRLVPTNSLTVSEDRRAFLRRAQRDGSIIIVDPLGNPR
jgi:hypothetical protein